MTKRIYEDIPDEKLTDYQKGKAKVIDSLHKPETWIVMLDESPAFFYEIKEAMAEAERGFSSGDGFDDDATLDD